MTTSVSSKKQESYGASPLVAATLIAGTVYMWVETIFRIAFTYNANFDAWYVLWNYRVGDIAAMWLTMTVVSCAAFLVLRYGLFRNKSRVGSLNLWITIFTLSVILAPLIGEIGTPIGI